MRGMITIGDVELIGKLHPVIEYIFNTPSHHRAHHGANPIYIDKNYSGTFILFDRIFNTFQEETEQTVFGLTTNLTTFNPFIANTHHWMYMYEVSKQFSGWRKCMVLFKGPGCNNLTYIICDLRGWFNVQFRNAVCLFISMCCCVLICCLQGIQAVATIPFPMSICANHHHTTQTMQDVE